MADVVHEIREGLADRLRTLGDGIQVNAYVLSNPTPPSAMVSLGPIDYDPVNARTWDDWTFHVLVIVGAVGDIGAQKRLGEFIAPYGTLSVKQALEADQTLGGKAMSVDVKSCTGQRTYENTVAFGGSQHPPYVGAEWTIEVTAAGKESE